jgi:hypothetical protein
MNQHPEILGVLKNYFDGIYHGDIELLRTAFHPQAILFGEIKGAPYYKTLDDYLRAVADRKSPHALGEAYRMNPVSIEVLGNIAFAKTHCVMLGFNYYDFLSLLLLEGRWVITSKLFTHVAP